MVALVAEFFGIIGADMVPPATFSELIPYLLQIFVGLVLVITVFRIFGGIARGFVFASRRV